MGFRFQKRVKLMPGVTLNLSRKGVSTSLGTTGARVTYGHGQKRTTVGIPGAGLSHTKVESTKPRNRGQASEEANLDSGASEQRSFKPIMLVGWVVVAVIVLVMIYG
jgi:hypothetical protein